MPATATGDDTVIYNRVPRVTADFWLIKLMAVTMGETAADYINVQLGLGLTATSLIMSAILAGALAWQFAQPRYVPASYWLSVVLISIVGTLITDNLVRREAFYWLAILFTFALGTAAGDLVAERFALGYLATGILFGMIILSLTVGYFFVGLDAILGFWLVYILTRPLGASLGDLMSQPRQYGGLGLGTIITSAIFLVVIITIVVYMSVQHEGEELAVLDEDEGPAAEAEERASASD